MQVRQLVRDSPREGCCVGWIQMTAPDFNAIVP